MTISNFVASDSSITITHFMYHEGRSESIERFAIQRYLLIIGKKKNM